MISYFLIAGNTIHALIIAFHNHPHFNPEISRLDLVSQSYFMIIIWLMKLTLIAVTVSTSLSFTSQLFPTVAAPANKKVEGVIIVAETAPVIIYQN